MKKPMTKEISQKMLQSNEESLKDLALLHYPELRDITQRIKTVLDAYGELGISRILEGLTPSEQAYRDICVVVKALNGGWYPDFNNKDWKYYPVFDMEEQVLYNVHYYSSCAIVPTTTLFKSRELVEYAASQFKHLYIVWLKP